jgi:hypothetical protein
MDCSVFILHLQQNILAQQLKRLGFLPETSQQPIKSKGFFTSTGTVSTARTCTAFAKTLLSDLAAGPA